MKLGTDRSPKERGWSAAAEPVPDAAGRGCSSHELIQRVLQAAAAREVPPAEGHAPMLLQDRALQPLDEPIGPGLARLGAGVANPERPTGLIEGTP